ncbi:MAG TPA: type II secretion system F family protein, partial [bacterium]|nr:type II secretion system F family protein [bacterium]
DVLIQCCAFLLTALMFLMFGFLVFLGWGRGNRFLDRLSLNATFWGTILRQSHASVVGKVLSGLLEAGVSLSESLILCAEMTPNACVRDSLLLAHRKVNQGESLGQALRIYPVFSEWFNWSVESLEKMSALPQGLSVLAEQLEYRTRLAITLFHRVLSPILVVTVWLATIAILYAPFFRISRMLGLFMIN